MDTFDDVANVLDGSARLEATKSVNFIFSDQMYLPRSSLSEAFKTSSIGSSGLVFFYFQFQSKKTFDTSRPVAPLVENAEVPVLLCTTPIPL